MDKSDRIYHIWDREDGVRITYDLDTRRRTLPSKEVYRALCGFKGTNRGPQSIAEESGWAATRFNCEGCLLLRLQREAERCTTS